MNTHQEEAEEMQRIANDAKADAEKSHIKVRVELVDLT